MFSDKQFREAAETRQAALPSLVERAKARPGLPVDVARSQPFPARLRAQMTQSDGKDFVMITGNASAYNQAYEVWDMFGPYMETVASGAGAKSLSSDPDVVFLVNHKGVALARTNGTLSLAETDEGLTFAAQCNPKRQDAADLITAIDDGVITECSFAFQICGGQWSPDMMSYTVMEYNIDRGDVSACNFGANPYTSIEARSNMLRALERLEGRDLSSVYEALGMRLERHLDDGKPEDKTGASVEFLRQMIEIGRI